jgi:hypothetical protein
MLSCAVRLAGFKHYIRPEDIVTDEVVCEREPDCPYDGEAIAVFMIVGEQKTKIGYLPKQVAHQLVRHAFPQKGLLVRDERELKVEI